ncbi:MAG: c-type cytochrome [Planctomycetaceae bacterium]|nr:c-type cytochrome [Planctomycetaceae bacterium]
MRRRTFCLILACLAGAGRSRAEAPDSSQGASAARGKEAVHRAMNPSHWSPRAYDEAWKQWGLAERPADYGAAFRSRYGLHPAPYDNDGLPMGFHRARGVLGVGRGLGNDCLLCHAGRIAGRVIIGLGNTALDMQTLYEELFAADGLDPATPLPLSHVRGTTLASSFAVYLMQFRDPELRLRPPVRLGYPTTNVEDAPAWWHFKKKRTIYYTGAVDTRSVRTMMSFLLNPLNGAESIKALEPVFADIRAYLLSLEPPRYPYPIDGELAARGKTIFDRTCARCHGTYGPDGRYPNKVVPLDEIGTDRAFAEGFPDDTWAYYLKSWFAREHGPGGEPYHLYNGGGYQAPPLDGLWATAPYLHNGSVPTAHGVLKSGSRPKVFTRSFRGEEEDYDRRKLGWKVTVLGGPPAPDLPAIERRKVYDTSQPGRGNGGHTFGDRLTDDQRMAVIEYLKTL